MNGDGNNLSSAATRATGHWHVKCKERSYRSCSYHVTESLRLTCVWNVEPCWDKTSPLMNLMKTFICTLVCFLWPNHVTFTSVWMLLHKHTVVCVNACCDRRQFSDVSAGSVRQTACDLCCFGPLALLQKLQKTSKTHITSWQKITHWNTCAEADIHTTWDLFLTQKYHMASKTQKSCIDVFWFFYWHFWSLTASVPIRGFRTGGTFS